MSCHKKYCQGKNNDFSLWNIEVLEYVVTNDRIKFDMKKVKAIQEWKWPLTQKGLRSFLRLANYYRCFIQHFSKVARTLSKIFKEGMSQEGDEPCHQVLRELKNNLSSLPVLNSWSLTSLLRCRRRQWFWHRQSVGAQWKALTYKSKKLDRCQKRRPPHDKRLFVVVHDLGVWPLFGLHG